MKLRDRIDPASRVPLEELLRFFPGGFNAIADVQARRDALEGALRMMTAELPPNENVLKEDRQIPGPENAPELCTRQKPARSEKAIDFMLVASVEI